MITTELVFLFNVLILAFAGRHDIYSGYSVLEIPLRDSSQQQFLHDLNQQFNLDVWQHGLAGARDAVVMVTREEKAEFMRLLKAEGLEYSVQTEDVSEVLETEDKQMQLWKSRRNGRLVPFDDYPRYAEVDAYLEEVAAAYPDIVTLVNAGQSYEGRDIKYLKISTTNFTDTSKPIYYLDATIHAREWVTTPVALYSIHRLVEELRTEDRDLLEETDWIVMPIVNPDGYEYTHTDERLWRLTRSINPFNASCPGVDANRNFDVSFNTIGVSAEPCQQTFPGYEAFSEPETRIVRDILHEYLERIHLYLNIHSYGNYVLFGFGNRTLAGNVVKLHHVGATMGAVIDAMKLPQSEYYLVGNSAMVLYQTSGTASDYAQHIGIPFSYTLELPSMGYFFQVPPQFIGQVNEETWQGIAASARLSALYYRERV